eukprot:jgi/Psemu1/254535/estExt_Genewise1Plus.C_1030027
MPLDFTPAPNNRNPVSSITSSAKSFFGSLSRSASSITTDRSSAPSTSLDKDKDKDNFNDKDGNEYDDEHDDDVDRPKKTIYLIRHAESEENVKMHALQNVGTSLLERRLPSSGDVTDSFRFLGGAAMGDTDSVLSEAGRQQVRELHDILEAEPQQQKQACGDGDGNGNGGVNVRVRDADVIAHSPLVRARDTCYGAFGLDLIELGLDPDPDGSSCCKNNKNVCNNVVELPCLEEATPWETAVKGRKNTVHKRIDELHDWIDEQIETKGAETIVLVGHSEYFMIMLGIPRSEKFWNCDVWKVEYSYSNSCGRGRKWTGLELRHRLASSKPMGIL